MRRERERKLPYTARRLVFPGGLPRSNQQCLGGSQPASTLLISRDESNPLNRYKLAEKLSDRLDEMGKDLTSMIEEINDASLNLGKNAKADDPVS